MSDPARPPSPYQPTPIDPSAPTATGARRRRIAVCDVNTMFVTVARMGNPALEAVPLLIVGGGGERGVVTSADYPVRAFGVRAGMPIRQALRLCPEATVVPVPGALVEAKSRELEAVLERFAPTAMMSVDEAALDFEGTQETIYRGEPWATTLGRVRAAVRAETGLTVAIGACHTGLSLAKIASDYAKPSKGCESGVLVVAPGEEIAFMRRVGDLGAIPGVGPKAVERYHAIGLRSVDDVLRLTMPELQMMLDEREARWLYDRVRGIDGFDLTTDTGGPAKSQGRAETFDRDLHTDAELETELLRLVDRVAEELRAEGRTARNVRVTLRDADFRTRQAQQTLPEAVSTTRAVFAVARDLLARLRRERRVGARLLGVTLSRFGDEHAYDQMALFEDPVADRATGALETDKDRRLMAAVDKLRAKFGRDAVTPATLAATDEDSATAGDGDALRNPFGPGPRKRRS